MRLISCVVLFSLCMLLGCSLEKLPLNKTRLCQKPVLGNPQQVGTNRLEFSITLSNISDVSTVVWKVSGPATVAPTQNDKNGYRATVVSGGIYTIVVEYTTQCGDKEELRTSYTTVGCNRPNDKLTINPNDADPTKTTFILEGNTVDIKMVSWRNGSTTIADKNTQTPFVLDFDFQRGVTYSISISYTDNCGTTNIVAADAYSPRNCIVPSNIRAIPAGSGLSIPLAFDGQTTDLKSVTWTVTEVSNNTTVFSQNYTSSPFTPSSNVPLPTGGKTYRIEAKYTDNCGGTNLVFQLNYTAPELGISSSGNFFAWRAGSSGDDRGNTVATDKFGNVYMAGNYGGAIDFGNGLLALRGNNDVFVAKYSSNGIFAWVQRISGSGGDEGKSIAVDPSTGDVYVTGQVSAGAQFFNEASFARNNTNVISETNNTNDVFVVKYDPNGKKLWHKLYGGGGADQGVSINLHSSGVYVTGVFTFPNATFGSLKINANGEESKQDIFLTKLSNSDGNALWAVAIGGYDNDFASAVSVDTDGTSYITGSVASPALFRSASGASVSRSSNATPDIFIAKYSSDGNFLQSHMAESGNNSFGNGIKVQGNAVYLTGLINGTRYAAQTITNRGGTDVFLGKYTKDNLSIQWIQTMGASGNDAGNSLDVDSQGNVYVTGYFSDNAVFSNQAPIKTVGGNDIFVTCYDLNSNFKWVKYTGSSGNDGGASIKLNAAESVLYFSGFYGAAFNFPPNLSYSGGLFDIFFGKYPD